MATLKLKDTGKFDDWDRGIYVDAKRKKYVDVDLMPSNPFIHTTSRSGEPEYPVGDYEIVESF